MSLKGWLIVNGFYHSDSFDRLYEALLCQAQALGLSLMLKTNEELCPFPDEALQDRPDFVLFWDKDVRLAYQLESLGIKVFNSARSIALCDDKTLTYLALKNSVPMPETILGPTAFSGYGEAAFLCRVEQALSYPFVIKEGFGSFGQQVYLVSERSEALDRLRKTGEKPLLFQRFISESAGRDLRVYVCGGKCVAAMERLAPPGDFRANIMNGGKARAHRLTAKEEAISLTAAETLGLTFAGVDLLFSVHGPLLCEVNSNAHFFGLQKMTDTDIPKEILLSVMRALRS